MEQDYEERIRQDLALINECAVEYERRLEQPNLPPRKRYLYLKTLTELDRTGDFFADILEGNAPRPQHFVGQLVRSEA